MAKKKNSNNNSSSKDGNSNNNQQKTKTKSNSKSETNGKPKTSTNGSSSSGKASASASAASLGVPLVVCVLIGVTSLCLGLISPRLLKAYQERSVATTKRKLSKSSMATTMSTTADADTDATMTDLNPPHEFPCTSESLASVLHEKPVKGMHVICMDQTMKSLKLTLYPQAHNTSNPVTRELEGLPTWDAFKSTLQYHLKLSKMDNLHQPWALFSPDGELLLREDNEQVQMDGLVQMGMILLYQGGQFLWPGVRIGFQRTISLKYQDAPPRTATLETLSLEPLVFSVEGFLAEDECDFFQQEAKPTLKYSEVTLMDMDKGRPASDFRTSQSTFLTNNDHAMIREIDYRTASLVRVPRYHQENVQVLRYGGGEKYDAHHDYFDKALYQNDPSTLKNFIQYGRRNRMITVFWYLSDVEEGGETIFPRFGGAPPPRNMADCHTGLKVKPVRGKVIIFYSLKPDGSLDPLSLHGACPVKKGIKWAANKWVWNAPIEFGSGR